MQPLCRVADKELSLPVTSKIFFNFHLFNLSEQQTMSKSEVLTQTKASLWCHNWFISF